MDVKKLSALMEKGIECGKNNEIKKAINNFKAAQKIAPDNPIVLYNLAHAYQELNKNKLAVKYYKLVMAILGNDEMTMLSLGSIYQKQNKFDQAIDLYNQILKFSPNHPEVLSNLGAIYIKQSKPKKAIGYLKKALEFNPELAKANYNLGNAYYLLGKTDIAKKFLTKAIALDPEYIKAINLLSSMLIEQGNSNKAIKLLKKAIMANPNEVSHIVNLANILRDTNQAEMSAKLYEQAMNLNPDYVDIYPYYYSQLKISCDWENLPKLEDKIDLYNSAAIKKNIPVPETPFNNITRISDPKENLKISKAWAEKLEASSKFFKTNFDFSKLNNKKIRIGYISADFNAHPVNLQLFPMYKLHDRKKFEVFAYSYGEDDKSEYRKAVELGVDHFVDIRKLHHLESARKIYADKINILIDLTGFTRNSRTEILALKPAPIQISYLGFPGSTGANFMDYIITDRIITPSDQQKYYTEKFLYIPKCYQVNHPLPFSKKIFTRKECGIPEDEIVFACFNKTAKFEPDIFRVWMKILRQVSGSVLWIWIPDNNKSASINIRKYAKKNGVNPKRIVMAKKVPIEEHLSRLKLADIALDTKTYSGGATTSNTLWAGVPVITILGTHYLSRMSSSLVTNIGLPELVTKNLDEYEKLAIDLAKDKNRLIKLKKKLWKLRESSSLYDLERYVNEMENLYLKVWNEHRDG